MDSPTRNRRIASHARSHARSRGGGENRPVSELIVGGINTAESRGELLEVQGFDLVAQLEAMLRYAHEYQREVQRFRGILSGHQPDTAHIQVRAAVQHNIDAMEQASETLADTLADTRRTSDSLAHPDVLANGSS